MRPGRGTRATAPRWPAAVAAACTLLAACSGGNGGNGGQPGSASRPSLAPGGRLPPGAFGIIGRGGSQPGGPGLHRTFVVGVAPGGPGLPAFIAPGGLPRGGSGGRPQIVVPPVPPASSQRPIAMPLDSYEAVAGDEQEVLAQASSLLTQRCMESRGFSYTQAALPSTELASLQQTENSPVGLTSLSQAETYGYAAPRTGGGAGPQFFGMVSIHTFVHAIQTNGPAWVTALLGFTPGQGQQGPAGHEGCVQVVTTELYGPDRGSANPDPVPGIALQALQWTQSDPRVLLVDRAWSACMARHGYSYSSPLGPQQRNWPSAPSPVEIATAVADVTCKTETNLTNTWLTVEAAYQLALIGQNLTALSQLQASFGALLRRADNLLATSGLAAAGS